MKDKIGESLNLPPLEIEHDDVDYDVVENDEKSSDVEYAKKNIEKLIATGHSTLEVLALFAKNSESPTAFEVVAKLIKTMLEANKDYVALSHRENKETETKKTSTTNNNLFVGSTDEFQKMIEKLEKDNDDTE